MNAKHISLVFAFLSFFISAHPESCPLCDRICPNSIAVIKHINNTCILANSDLFKNACDHTHALHTLKNTYYYLAHNYHVEKQSCNIFLYKKIQELLANPSVNSELKKWAIEMETILTSGLIITSDN